MRQTIQEYIIVDILLVHCDSAKSEPLMLARGEDNPVSISEHQKT